MVFLIAFRSRCPCSPIATRRARDWARSVRTKKRQNIRGRTAKRETKERIYHYHYLRNVAYHLTHIRSLCLFYLFISIYNYFNLLNNTPNRQTGINFNFQLQRERNYLARRTGTFKGKVLRKKARKVFHNV